jgi:hypothetical protein
VFSFSIELLSETHLILRRIQRDVTINVRRFFVQTTLFYCQVLMKLELLDSCPKNTELSYFMKIRPLVAELFHAGGRTDRRDEAYARFSFANSSETKNERFTVLLCCLYYTPCVFVLTYQVILSICASFNLWRPRTT